MEYKLGIIAGIQWQNEMQCTDLTQELKSEHVLNSNWRIDHIDDWWSWTKEDQSDFIIHI